MTFGAFRTDGLPTNYSPNQTPVTADVLVYGFVFAFLVIAFSLFVILPGIRGWQRLFVLCRITISLFIGASIMLSNFGQSWEVSLISNVTTAYRAGRSGELHADIGVKIGLRSVNITLKGVPEYPDGDSAASGERVNYNERFHFEGSQGRNGFGRYAGRINREFREAQYRGLPYPIMWVAEYFVLDGEGIRWGRSYRLAGFYTAILVWLSFPLWLITNIILMSGVLYHGLFMLLLTGGCMLAANIMFASIRYESQLVIPFSADHILRFSYGWSFYLCLVGGLVAIILAIIGLAVLFFSPDDIEEFFGTKEEVDDVEYYHRRRPRSAGEIKKAWTTAGNKVNQQLNGDINTKTFKRSRKRRLTLADATDILFRPKPVVVWEE